MGTISWIFQLQKGRVWGAKSMKKSVQDSNQNVMSFGDCFLDDFQRIFEVKMLVVPSSSHAKVDTCSRRAACEKTQ